MGNGDDGDYGDGKIHSFRLGLVLATLAETDWATLAETDWSPAGTRPQGCHCLYHWIGFRD